MRRIARAAILLGAALGGASPSTSEFEPTPIEQISGHECSIGDGGVHRFAAGPGDYFLIVVPTDGVAVEGSYGRDSAGVERPEDTHDWSCAFTQQLAGRCDLALLGETP